MNRKVKSRLYSFWREWVKPILIVLIVFGSFRSAVADWNDVPSGSMRPTILEGDRIFVNKMAYDLRFPFTSWRLARWGGPQHGDIVILFSPADGTRLVKRVIGLPGDKVAMINNRLFINGRPLAYEPMYAGAVGGIVADGASGPQIAREKIDHTVHPIIMTPRIPAMRTFGPVTLSDDEYFVMGDNRDKSRDSRFFGKVQRSSIVGKVSRVVISLDLDNYFKPRWDRFFQRLD
ncbi:MAG: signal peptidase I [Phycisphaerae bacterium]